MRKILALILAVLLLTVTFGGCKMQEFDAGNLPIIRINTEKGKNPKDKENYVNCSFEMTNCLDDDYNFSVSMKDSLEEDDSVGIRLRGNSTMTYKKKPYRVKFDKKQSVLGMEKNKSWVLLADYLDTSKIRNFTAFSIAKSFENLDFTPTPHHVVLYLNGKCKGLYLLCEQIDEKEGRTNVETDIDPNVMKDFPFLVEMDRNALSEGVTGVDNFETGYFQPIEIKYPEYDERNIPNGGTDVVFNYIKEYITAVFNSLTTGQKVDVSFRSEAVGFEDLVDVDSFIEYWLVNEIMFNADSTWGSIYMHKTADGKLKFGPVWDFDYSMAREWTNKPYKKSDIETATIFCILSANTPFRSFVQNPQNYKLVCDKWNEVKDNVLNVAIELGNYKSVIKDVAKADAEYWYSNKVASYFNTQYDSVRVYLMDRYVFLSEQLIESNHSKFLV